MKIKSVTDDISVAEQIAPADVKELASQGFKSIICNRPDAEAPDQPAFEAIRQAASVHGIATGNVPVVSGKISDIDVAAFGKTLRELPSPVLAYCRTGTRSTHLWALSQAEQGTEPGQLLAVAQKAGYDLTELRERLEKAYASAAGSDPAGQV
ncbi:MAG: TIGR01244 family sulfur transferase [Pseudohongiellaceae bacterium]